jgi:hypothetical protein
MDITVDTVRIVLVSRRKKCLATVFGFFTILIWLMAINQIMGDLKTSFVTWPMPALEPGDVSRPQGGQKAGFRGFSVETRDEGKEARSRASSIGNEEGRDGLHLGGSRGGDVRALVVGLELALDPQKLRGSLVDHAE